MSIPVLSSPNATSRIAPTAQILVNGRPLPPAVASAVTSVRFESGRDIAARVEVDIADPGLALLAGHIRGVGVTGYPTGVRIGPLRVDATRAGLLDLDNPLSLALGYAGAPLVDVFDGTVTGVEADLPAAGMPTVTLVAHDKLQRLAQGTAVRGFGPLPDFLIAAVLAGENLLLPAIDPAVVAMSAADSAAREFFEGSPTTQTGQSDLDLLAEIAARYGAHFWAEGDVLHLSRIPVELAPSTVLAWGASLLDLRPRVTMVGQIVSVTARFTMQWLPLDLVVTVGWDLDREALSVLVRPGAADALPGSASGPSLVLADQRVGNSADVVTSALTLLHALRSKLNDRITATGTAVGDPALLAGRMVRLAGIGADFSGDYRLVSATHVIDSSGYRTTFAVQRELLP